MISKDDGEPNWDRYRTNSGDFRTWLHVWSYVNLKDRRTNWAPMPWVCEQAPSGEFIEAMYHMGILRTWPGEWRRWRPALVTEDYYTRGVRPVYGILLSKSSDAALAQRLVSIRRQCLSDNDFKARLRRFILFK